MAKGALYFPTGIGDRWILQSPQFEHTSVVTDVCVGDGVTLVKVGSISNGTVYPAEEFAVSPGGLIEIGTGGRRVEMPFCHLKLPCPPEDTAAWENKDTAWVNGPCRTRRPEWVSVPAGRYWCVPVEMEYTIADKPGQTTRWFAEGVGLVKMLIGKEEYVLKSFTRGTGPYWWVRPEAFANLVRQVRIR